MEKLTTAKSIALRIEPVEAGDSSSRLSRAIILLLLVIPAFAAIVFGAVDSATWVVIDVMWLLLVLLWLAESFRGGGFIINPDRLLLPVIALLFIGLIQLLPLGSGNSDLIAGGVSRALSLDQYATRLFMMRLVVYLTFFAACLTFINSEKRLKAVVWFVIIFGTAMALFGILQRLAAPEGIYGMRNTPQAIPFGPFVNQHHFGSFMLMAAGVALGPLLGSRTRNDRRMLLAIAVTIIGSAVLFTSSRGAVLGAVVVGAVALFIGRRKGDSSISSRLKMIVAAGAVVAAVLMLVFLLGGNDSMFRGLGIENADSDLSSGRFRFWPIALKIFLDHPVVGAGFDAFGVAFTKFDTTNGAFRVEQAHNEYLQMLAEAGIGGILAVLGFIVLLTQKAMAAVRASDEGFRRDAAIGAFAGCCGVIVHSIFDFPLRTPSNAFFFLLLCSIVAVQLKAASRRRKQST